MESMQVILNIQIGHVLWIVHINVFSENVLVITCENTETYFNNKNEKISLNGIIFSLLKEILKKAKNYYMIMV